MPGPSSVNILGHLCLIATGPDFPLLEAGSDFKFDRLRSPESYRASLCQISNEGYWAFLEADTQMEKIRMMTEQVAFVFKPKTFPLFSDPWRPEELSQDSFHWIC